MESWCCIEFEKSLELVGEKGCSIIANDSLNCFCIIACPFEREVAKYLFSMNPETGRNRVPDIRDKDGNAISLTCALFRPIKYCIYCGKELDSLIKSNKKKFDALAKKQLPLWKSWDK